MGRNSNWSDVKKREQRPFQESIVVPSSGGTISASGPTYKPPPSESKNISTLSFILASTTFRHHIDYDMAVKKATTI